MWQILYLRVETLKDFKAMCLTHTTPPPTQIKTLFSALSCLLWSTMVWQSKCLHFELYLMLSQADYLSVCRFMCLLFFCNVQPPLTTPNLLSLKFISSVKYCELSQRNSSRLKIVSSFYTRSCIDVC